MSALAPHALPEQKIVMNTATGFGSLFLSRILADRNVRPTIIDLATIVRMSRISGPNRVRLGTLKPGVDFATIPAERGEAGGMLLTKLFSDLFD
jgi:opine dehydrogenase